MTVRRDELGTIVLEGHCPVDDTEPLFQMLQATPAGPVDWTQCSRLHTCHRPVVAGGAAPLHRTVRLISLWPSSFRLTSCER